MKKKMMRLAAIFAVVVLLVSCVETKTAVKNIDRISPRSEKARGKQSDEVKLTHKLIQKGQAGSDEVTLTLDRKSVV